MPKRVKRICEGEDFRIPINIEHVKEVTHGLVIYPEHAVVELLRVCRVVVESFTKFGSPAFLVLLGVATLPTKMCPWILNKRVINLETELPSTTVIACPQISSSPELRRRVDQPGLETEIV